MQYEKTINAILQKLSKDIPIAEVGDILETHRTLYPNPNESREDKNIVINCTEITPPLACSKEWKKAMLRDKAVLCEIYKDFNRGDILKIKKINGSKIVVENISIDEEFRREFEIDKMEIVKKNFSLIRRKSVELLRSLEKLELL